MQYDYFIASKYRNKEAVLKLTQQLREKGKSVYCFIESKASLTHVGKIEDDTETSVQKLESIQDWRNSAAVREVFESDMNALRASETVVVLLPAGNSVHTEAGAAYGFGKKLVLVGKPEKTESLYLIFNEHFETAEEFLNSIYGKAN